MKRREFISISAITLGASASGSVFGRGLSKLLPNVNSCISHHGNVYKAILTQVRQLTTARYGHILTNARVWSPDGKWIVYDIRSDAKGAVFDGSRIERVNLKTKQVQVLYRARGKAKVGVVTYDPIHNRVAFIHGPNHLASDWQYAPYHRHGVIVNVDTRISCNLDARDITPPFTPGALRGGTHVHIFEGHGKWVGFSYEDVVLASAKTKSGYELNERNIGVSVPVHPVIVGKDNPHNHDGCMFSAVVTRTWDHPKPGSDEINRASEQAWVGINGYTRSDGQQQRALAFRGRVTTTDGKPLTELFIVDLPKDVTKRGKDGSLAGTTTTRPNPPLDTIQRRLTYTASRRYPGLQGPRFWPQSSPDGSHIAFLMCDDSGIVQFWIISPRGGEPLQITYLPFSVASAFTWSPNGEYIAFAADQSIFLVRVDARRCFRLTRKESKIDAPLPLAVVFSPNGKHIAYQRRVISSKGKRFNQIFVVEMPDHF